jgi:hypothetical protein
MPNPRLLLPAFLLLATSGTSCPRDARYVQYRWELPPGPDAAALPDTMVEGKIVMTRSETARLPDCGRFQSYDLTKRRAILGPAPGYNGIYVGFAADSSRALEILLTEDDRSDRTADALAAQVGRLVIAGAGVSAPTGPPVRTVVDSTELSAKWCVER